MSISPNLKSNIKLRSGVSGISITGKNISKTFGEGDMKTTAVNDVSIEIKQGEVALMMGPSGSGKTTLLASHTPKALTALPYNSHNQKRNIQNDSHK
ncbi:MAG: ATP-binding cassette domain-containing protein [Microbacteriaceae bacterium]|nr:ATP-binding cassette domain-containing protein [Microbacteriaceae bacterium]